MNQNSEVQVFSGSASRSKLVHRALTASLLTAMLGVPLASPAGAALQRLGMSTPADVSSAQMGPELSAWGGRYGSSLDKVWVAAYVSSADAYGLLGQPVVLQKLVAGGWSDHASTPIPSEGPVQFVLTEKGAVTLRLTVPAAGLVSPELALPAGPESGRSRYYVRSLGESGARHILRVFEDGTAIGAVWDGMEYRCEVGSLANGRLTLKSFDYGGYTVALRASGTWKNLKIRSSKSTPISGPLKALKGKNLKYMRNCAAITYVDVSPKP